MNTFLKEDPARRAKWADITGGARGDNHDLYEHGVESEYRDKIANPAMARRMTEIALESTTAFLSQHPSAGGVGKNLRALKNALEIQEAIDSSAIAPFQKFSLGLVRRVIPKLIADSLVSIQTMQTPSAPLFYLDFLYGTAKAPTAVGDRIDLISSRNETYGGARFYDEVGIGTGAQTTFNAAHAGTLTHQVYFNGVLQTSPGLTVNAGAGPGGVDEFVFAVAPGNGVEVVISYLGYNECDTPRDIDLELTSKNVEAEDHALRAGFTIQTLQNAQAFHDIDVDAELTAAMAQELVAEIDALILFELFPFAGAGNVVFNSGGYLPGDTSTADRKAYDATLYDRINDAANLIWTLRHQMPTWIVGGTDAIKRLENLEQYSSFRSPNPDMSNMSEIRHRVPMGTLGGMQYTVYKDARMPSDKLLLGYKGVDPFHVGYIWAPFVMMYMTDLLPDPSANFKFKRGMMHRAGRCRVDMNLYATVTIV